MDYRYLGYNDAKKIIEGTLVADTAEIARRMLVEQGFRVLDLKPAAGGFSLSKLLADLYRVKPAHLVMFSRQLALLIESGVDIITALNLLREQVDGKPFKKALAEVSGDLRGGNSLAVAMAKHPRVFSNLYCNMIAVGEKTGGLETVARQVADYMERENVAVKKVKNALAYPTVVIIIAVIVALVLMMVALPPLVNMFTSLGAELPLPTQILIGLTGFMTAHGIKLILGLVVAAGLLYTWVRTPKGRFILHKFLLRIPVLGRVILLQELSRLCRCMSLLFRGGLSLPEIMALVIQSSNNQVISAALVKVRQLMLAGEGLAKPIAANPLFPALMVQMVKIGEETGNLDATLITVAEAYETEAADKTATLIRMIEPTMTVLIAVVVGFIALAMFMPMYSILSVVE
jgi:type IV pilus assembly protein PilC